MAAEQLIVYQRVYRFSLWFLPLVNRFPKHYRPSFGRRLEDLTLDLLLLIVKANKARGNERLLLQQKLSDQLDMLRICLRIAKDLGLVSRRQQVIGADLLNEIGKLLTGWRNISG